MRKDALCLLLCFTVHPLNHPSVLVPRSLMIPAQKYPWAIPVIVAFVCILSITLCLVVFGQKVRKQRHQLKSKSWRPCLFLGCILLQSMAGALFCSAATSWQFFRCAYMELRRYFLGRLSQSIWMIRFAGDGLCH
jgi:hypothetical protein